jgi:hypothetical protein
MARAVVADPAAVTVEEVVAQHMLVLNLIVAKNDMGRVIGKKGRVANAMRMVLWAATKGEQRVSLEIRPSQEQEQDLT